VFREIMHTGGVNILPHPKSRLGKLAVVTLPYVVLYVIGIVLIAMTDRNPASTQGAWDYFIPLVGVVATVSGWSRHAGDIWQTHARYVLRQVMHWAALLLVIHLLFQADVQHFLKAQTDGFVIIYLLGLGAILSGLYLDWKMAVFGLFMIFSGVSIAFLDDNALMIVVGGTATVAVIVTAFVWIRHQERRESQVDQAR
jgi:hypothetical protein